MSWDGFRSYPQDLETGGPKQNLVGNEMEMYLKLMNNRKHPCILATWEPKESFEKITPNKPIRTEI